LTGYWIYTFVFKIDMFAMYMRLKAKEDRCKNPRRFMFVVSVLINLMLLITLIAGN